MAVQFGLDGGGRGGVGECLFSVGFGGGDGVALESSDGALGFAGGGFFGGVALPSDGQRGGAGKQSHY